MHDRPTECRRSGEVRTGFIDPATGEPRYTEPSPKAPHSSKKRPVLVDGVLFESVSAASKEVGCTSQALGIALRKGSPICNGRRVEFA